MKVDQNAASALAKHILLAAMSLFLPATAQETADLPGLRSTLEKWVETKKMISREKQEAREKEQMLQARIDLLKLRLEDVNARSAEIRKNTEEAGEKRASLDSESATLEGAIGQLQERVDNLEERVMALLSIVPEPLRIKLEPLSHQIPDRSEQSDLSLSLRYQNVIGILNAMNNFNNEVTLTTEVRELPEAGPVEVRVLYFGLSAAYFCNKDASVGGVGRPDADGWNWERRDDIAPVVANMIAQHLNERPADYEAVPVTVTNARNLSQ